MSDHVRLLLTFILTAFVAFPVTYLSAENLPAEEDRSSAVLTSSDGKCKITLPDGWTELTDLNDQVGLGAGAPEKEQYLIVLTESKDDFQGMTLARFTQVAIENLTSSITNSQVEPSTEILIDGKQATRQMITGKYKNLPVKYLLVSVESSKNYHQILAWTLADQFGTALPVLEDALSSFREIS